MRKKRRYTKVLLFITGLIVILGTTIMAQAQLRIAEPQSMGNVIKCYVGGSASYTLIPKKRLQFMPSIGELQKILDKISRHTNLVIPIEVVAVENSDNAEACPSDGGKNYIAFKTEWLQGLYDETNNEWSIYAVLAHEIGHFALNHDRVPYEPKLEKQADEYAGKILSLMGANLEDTLLTFRSRHMRGRPGGKYPSRDERIAAAKKGWESAKNPNNVSNNTVETEKQANAYKYYSKGIDLFEQEKWREAAANFSAAIAIDPDDAYAYYSRGMCKSRYKDYQGAIEDFNKTLQINPNFTNAYYSRGIVKNYDLKDYRGAIKDLSKAIEIEPNHVEAYYVRAWTKADGLKDYRGAIEDFSKAIDIEPDNARAYYGRGLVKKYDLKDKSGARADFGKACELGYDEGCKAAR
jgi:Tfp pilus assembly protein PilF